MEKKNRLVVADIGWANTIPNWLKKEVEKERLIEGFKNAAAITKTNGGVGKVGLAETCVYLYTLGLRQPLDHYYTRIHLFVTGRVIEKAGGKVPDDIRVAELEEDEQRLLDDLREDLYRKRGGEIRSPLFDALRELKREIFSRAPAGKR